MEDPNEIHRLIVALCAAGTVLLALEIGLPGMGMGIIGLLSVLGAVGIGFRYVGIETGSLLLLGFTTLVSLGFLSTLAFFPKAPLSRRWLKRISGIVAEEEEKKEES